MYNRITVYDSTRTIILNTYLTPTAYLRAKDDLTTHGRASIPIQPGMSVIIDSIRSVHIDDTKVGSNNDKQINVYLK